MIDVEAQLTAALATHPPSLDIDLPARIVAIIERRAAARRRAALIAAIVGLAMNAAALYAGLGWADRALAGASADWVSAVAWGLPIAILGAILAAAAGSLAAAVLLRGMPRAILTVNPVAAGHA